VAIEVKLTDTIRPADVEHLNWLHQQLGDRLVDRMIIYTGRLAYRRPDGIAIVPLALLGP
ncbi:MAG TPA: AAA family ATPase, partial [Propionibacteriaceae bacterium]|nr:AAA family ATPase [Propionibacteriaceae bacterium]